MKFDISFRHYHGTDWKGGNLNHLSSQLWTIPWTPNISTLRSLLRDLDCLLYLSKSLLPWIKASSVDFPIQIQMQQTEKREREKKTIKDTLRFQSFVRWQH